MSNAAISFLFEGFDTAAPALMGRQAAGEGFLRGFLRHADVDRLYFADLYGSSPAKGEALIRRIEPTLKPIDWIGRETLPRLAEPGCLFVSSPLNAAEAWRRRVLGPKLYSICGLTHATASEATMDALAAMITAPVEPWDALICTSEAVKRSTQTQLSLVMRYLQERFGQAEPPALRLETIPLGVNCDDFVRSDAHRAHWRTALGIEEDAIAVLYVGRFSAHAKMNPVPMAMALERAARRTRRPIHWILSGWAANEHLHATFAGVGPKYAPSVTTHVLDGRRAEVRFPIWSAADVFLSLSDNIQESFGLTPVEAMAAGLPSVVSDWDGYRDLIQDGVEGYRVTTLAPRPGFALDLAFAHANGWETYDRYVGTTSQFVAPDVDAAADALLRLLENDDLRRTMGAAAQHRARTVFDWKTVIGQYQALWGELAAIRKAAPLKPAGSMNPWRPDPFRLFAAYPTRALDPADVISLTPDATVAAIHAMLDDPSVAYAAKSIMTRDEITLVVGALLEHGSMTVAETTVLVPAQRAGIVERSLLWMAKFGFARLSPRLDEG